MWEFSIPVELTINSILLLLCVEVRNCWQCALTSLCLCNVQSELKIPALDVSFEVPLAAASHPAGRAAGWMETCGGQLPISHVAGTSSLQHLSSHSLHFTFSSYKRTRKRIGLWQSRLQLITLYINAHTLYIACISSIQVFWDRAAANPSCWQCATRRSLIKTAKIPGPESANRWELARVQVLWDTVEGYSQICAGNCTADTALLRICHWTPLSPSTVFPYVPARLWKIPTGTWQY